MELRSLVWEGLTRLSTDVTDDSDRFIISANGSARIGAPIRKNQAGMLSSPVAVGCRCKSCVDCWNAILDSLDALSTG